MTYRYTKDAYCPFEHHNLETNCTMNIKISPHMLGWLANVPHTCKKARTLKHVPFRNCNDYPLDSLWDAVIELLIVAEFLIPVVDVITISEFNQLQKNTFVKDLQIKAFQKINAIKLQSQLWFFVMGLKISHPTGTRRRCNGADLVPWDTRRCSVLQCDSTVRCILVSLPLISLISCRCSWDDPLYIVPWVRCCF